MRSILFSVVILSAVMLCVSCGVREAASPTAAEACEHYLRLTAAKDELVPLVSQRVEEYRAGEHPEPEMHHPAWPDSFPPASKLPSIESAQDFSIRQEAETDALGSVYAAVRIDGEHELRMTIARSRGADGNESWASGDTFFVSAGEPDFDSWVLSDTGE